MAQELSISVDLSELLAIGAIARAEIFEQLAQSVEGVAQAGVERWQRAALKAPLWDGERRAYADSIQYRMSGRYEAEIVSDYKYVEDIESGRPPYDMKRMLDTSLKVRLNKRGERYLIIPFRHNTPGQTAHAPAMPKDVYGVAKHLAPSAITGHYARRSGTGAWDVKTKEPARVRSRLYAWGDRLPRGLDSNKGRSDRYAGMVRFKESSGGSTYLTFRVMSARSSGWIIPAKPGLWIARMVAESLQRTADVDFPAALQRDLDDA